MKVYFDSNCIIYLVEAVPVWGPKIIARIGILRTAGDEMAVGDLARAECYVKPFQTGNAGLEARYRAFFADPDVLALPITLPVLERAARIRATHHSIKLPDALHLAIAIEHGCGAFVTVDARLAACTEIVVEVLK